MLDRGEPAAVVMNATVYTVVVDPMMANEEEVAGKLTEILGEKRTAEWSEVFKNKALRYYVVGKSVERGRRRRSRSRGWLGYGCRVGRGEFIRKDSWARLC